MLTLRSSSFAEGQEIPARHGKRDRNLSPEVDWADVPEGTESFALSVVDTDPAARGYVHWLVVDIDARLTTLPEGAAGGAMPKGAYEAVPYSGPFPPSGTHSYEFTLYALAAPRLELPQGRLTLAEFLDAVSPYALATAVMIGTFTAAS